MPDTKKPSYEELAAELSKSKKDAAVAKRAKTAAEKKASDAVDLAEARGRQVELAKKEAAEALEAAEAAEVEAAAARRSAERVDEEKGSVSEEMAAEEPILYATMAKRDPTIGHFRRSHSACYGGRFFKFAEGATSPVPAGLAEALDDVRDKRVQGTPTGAKIFKISDKPAG